MVRANLALHCGANACDLDQVKAVHTPDATDTWTPVPHIDLVESVKERLRTGMLDVVNEKYALTKGGNRLFGLVQCKLANQEDQDYGLVVGIRNSHDKSFPAALVLGSQVFVCDNLAFSGEIKLSRKHTRWISRDLPHLVERAVSKLITARGHQDARIAAYKQFELTDYHASDLIIRAFEGGVIGSNRISDVVKQWRTPNHPEFMLNGKTAWTLFNAFTEAMKGYDLQAMPARTNKLYGLLDVESGVSASAIEQAVMAV